MSDTPKSLRVVVTGASGSLGRRVVARLCEHKGVHAVLALDRVSLPFQHPNLEARICDVRDPDLAEQLRGSDCVVHLAFIVEHGSRDAAETEAINLGGTRNVFEAAAAAGVGQVVYASSLAAYGFHADTDGVLLDESAEIRGNEGFYYGAHKAANERWLDGFEARHPKIRVARLRPSIFLGEGSARSVDALRRRLHFYLTGPQPRTQIAHQDDVADAFVLAVEKGAAGAFNVANEEPLSMREMGRAMGKRSLRLPKGLLALHRLAWRAKLVDVDPVWFETTSGPTLIASSEKIRKELGWKPRWETTGDVLRQISGRPNARASHAVKAYLGPLRRITRLFGGLPLGREARSEARGMQGSINLVFTGEQPSRWHFTLGDSRLGVHEGTIDDARATISMRDRVFQDMLAGKLAPSTAMMTGKVRMRGDGEMGFLVGGLVGGFARLRRAAGWKGLGARRYAAWVLREVEKP